MLVSECSVVKKTTGVQNEVEMEGGKRDLEEEGNPRRNLYAPSDSSRTDR
jgi:hypothetical protein